MDDANGDARADILVEDTIQYSPQAAGVELLLARPVRGFTPGGLAEIGQRRTASGHGVDGQPNAVAFIRRDADVAARFGATAMTGSFEPPNTFVLHDQSGTRTNIDFRRGRDLDGDRQPDLVVEVLQEDWTREGWVFSAATTPMSRKRIRRRSSCARAGVKRNDRRTGDAREDADESTTAHGWRRQELRQPHLRRRLPEAGLHGDPVESQTPLLGILAGGAQQMTGDGRTDGRPAGRFHVGRRAATEITRCRSTSGSVASIIGCRWRIAPDAANWIGSCLAIPPSRCTGSCGACSARRWRRWCGGRRPPVRRARARDDTPTTRRVVSNPTARIRPTIDGEPTRRTAAESSALTGGGTAFNGKANRRWAEVVDREHEPDDDARAWQEQPARSRVRILTRRFASAIAQLQRDATDAGAVREAQDALSSLRSELYATERGRTQHRAMEAALVAVVPSGVGSQGGDHASGGGASP